MDNLHEHLVSSLQGCQSLLLQNYSGQHFIRVIPSACDQSLGFFPLVEVRLTQHEDIVTIAVVSFRRELLETSETRNKTEYGEIADVIRLMLFDKKYRICKGINYPKGRKTNYLSELWTEEQSQVTTLVFRSKKCKTVYPDPGADVSGVFICQSCSQSKPKRVKKSPVVEPQSVLEEHFIHDVDEDDEVLRVCPFEGCERTFKRRLPFENHLKTHKTSVKNVPKKVKKKTQTQPAKESFAHYCDPCQVGYNYEKSYLKHMRQHDKFICSICKECFTSIELLEKHSQTEHRKRERRKYQTDRELKCDQCNEEFLDLDSLSKHNIEHHGIRGDPCPVCGKYLQRSSMRNHIEKIHNSDNARKYTCHECGKVYKTKTDLDTHYTKHTGDKLFTCPTCGKSFRFWNGLDDCMRRHNSDMRYKCNWQGCSKTFNSKFRFDLHQRTHDGVKPFKCPLCIYDCSRKDNLVTHIKRSHKKTLEEIKQLDIGDTRNIEAEM